MGTSVEVRFRSLHPKKWSLKETSDELLLELERLALEAKGRLDLTVSTWASPKPAFRMSYGRGFPSWLSRTARIEISTNDERFVMVDQGTEAHSISPKNPVSRTNPNRPSALRTRAGYTAKSSPRRLSATVGGHYGPVVFKPGVWHPGIQPRQFMETLRQWTQAQGEIRLRQAMQRGLDRGMVQ